MAIRFHCPACDAVLKVPDQSAGRVGKCNKCGGRVQVPTVPTAAEGSIAGLSTVATEIAPNPTLSVSDPPASLSERTREVISGSPPSRSRRTRRDVAKFGLLIGLIVVPVSGLLAYLAARTLSDEVESSPQDTQASKSRSRKKTSSGTAGKNVSKSTSSLALKPLGYVQMSIKRADDTAVCLGVVVSVPASLLQPTEDEFDELLQEHRKRTSVGSKTSLPESARHVRLFRPAMFTLDFGKGRKSPAEAFVVPGKKDSDTFSVNSVTVTVRSEKEFPTDEVLTFSVAVVEDNKGKNWRPLRIQIRNKPAVAVPSKRFEPTELPPAPDVLQPIQIPNITIPQIKIPVVPRLQ